MASGTAGAEKEAEEWKCGGGGGGEEGGLGRGRKGYWGIGSLFGASPKAIGAPRAKMWEICRGGQLSVNLSCRDRAGLLSVDGLRPWLGAQEMGLHMGASYVTCLKGDIKTQQVWPLSPIPTRCHTDHIFDRSPIGITHWNVHV